MRRTRSRRNMTMRSPSACSVSATRCRPRARWWYNPGRRDPRPRAKQPLVSGQPPGPVVGDVAMTVRYRIVAMALAALAVPAAASAWPLVTAEEEQRDNAAPHDADAERLQTKAPPTIELT